MDQETIKLAVEHHRAGRGAEAERICRQILAHEPNDHVALNFLGALAAESGRNDEAIEWVSRAIAIHPVSAAYHSNLGEYCRRAGRLPQAFENHRRALELNPTMAAVHANLGAAFDDAGAFQAAIQAHSKAISLRPENSESHYNLGNTFMRIGDTEGAIRAFSQAVRLNPTFAPGHYNLGLAYFTNRQIAPAIESYTNALKLNPDYAEAANNLGLALESVDRHDEAIASYRHSLAIQPGNAQVYTNLGSALFESARFDEAIASLNRAMQLDPGFPDAHWNMALQQLLLGDYDKAWPEYEWRWKLKTNPPSPHISLPRWNGEALNGKTLLIHAEQGFGDTIQFFRFMPKVAQLGGRIIVECQRELQRLLAASTSMQVVAKGDSLPKFDLQCPLMSLPGILKIRADSIPHEMPYLRASEPFSATWTDHPRIGLVWTGSPTQKNDRRRSIALDRFAPLAQFNHVHYYSLQKGSAAAQKPASGLHLIDWMPRINDFADTAALIDQLDLILGVDTSVMHLAAAMGKPVWVLLPRVPPWHYGLDRTVSPWYPTMRLFRQPVAGDWETPIRQMTEALREWLEKYDAPGNT